MAQARGVGVFHTSVEGIALLLLSGNSVGINKKTLREFCHQFSIFESMRKVWIFLFFLLAGISLPGACHAAASYIMVPVQFVVVNGDFNEAMVYIRREGETVASFRGQKNMRLRLAYDAEYTIDFTKPGYITKSIHVNTLVEKERKKYGFDPYKIGVRLFKQYEGVNIVVYNQPVASIRYLPEMDEFGYDTDYTKSILSALSTAEAILEQKAREEIAQLQANREQEKEARSMLKKSNDHPEPKGSGPVTHVSKEETLPAETVQVLPADPVADPAPASEGDAHKSLPVTKPVQSGEEPSGGHDKMGSEEMPLSGAGDDGQEQHVVIVEEKSGTDAAPLPVVPEVELSRDIRQIVEPNRTITVYRMKQGDSIREFRNVNYKWGGMFYFMNETTPISEHLFKYMTTKPSSR